MRGKVGDAPRGRAGADRPHGDQRRREGALPGARDRPPGMTSRRRAALAAAGLLLLPGCTSFADTVAAVPAARRRPRAAGSRRAPVPRRPGRARPRPARGGAGLPPRGRPAHRHRHPGRRLHPRPGDRRAGVPAPAQHRRVRGGGQSPGRRRRPRPGRRVRRLRARRGGRPRRALRGRAGGRTGGGGVHPVELDFTLSLGSAAFDRVGTDQGVSWWASGAPLLAWEPGVGWARDPFVDVSGETASSPVADVTLRVSAPERLTVLMTGDQDPPSKAVGGRRTWTSADPSPATSAWRWASSRRPSGRRPAGSA